MKQLAQGFWDAYKFDHRSRIADEGRPDLRKLVNVHEYTEGQVMRRRRQGDGAAQPASADHRKLRSQIRVSRQDRGLLRTPPISRRSRLSRRAPTSWCTR